MARPLPPPLLMARPLREELFFVASLRKKPKFKHRSPFEAKSFKRNSPSPNNEKICFF